jgi:ABC-2 type transport system permease protein
VIALGQSLMIVLVGALASGVSWGNPIAAALLLLVWSHVGASAAMWAGTLFKTPEQASAIGPVAGITLGMLRGCMWPLSIVSPMMRQLGHATPQAWAVDAWTNLLSHGGTVATILPELGVLAAFAVAFLALGTARPRRVLA